MTLDQHANLTQADLLVLRSELGTWEAVRAQLGVSRHRFSALRSQLGYVPVPKQRLKPVTSSLDPYADQLRALAGQGFTCPEIVAALNLPVKDEQVRRWLHRHGIPLLAKRGAQPGEKNWAWKGGRIVDKDGYILIYKPDHPNANSNGYVREHRLVMEAKLGRYLESEEVVDHINGDRADNRPENLRLFPNNRTHLAVTLKGRVPRWSRNGSERVTEGLAKAWKKRAEMRRE